MPNDRKVSLASPRRGFLGQIARFGGLFAAAGAAGQAQTNMPGTATSALPAYARAMSHRSLKQSSFDRTGGNHDSWPIQPGESQVLFESDGPGVISHIWFTISAQGVNHLKEIIIRAYWDGNSQLSVEVPVGDFFGLNLGQYFIYQSAFLNCSSIKALNCYFAMPFKRSARITATNEGSRPVGSFYSNIDYQLMSNLPADAMYFHAQYRQSTPNQAQHFASEAAALNPNGERNYVFTETRGRGHLMGITLGVVQNAANWFGEGDEMIFIDGGDKPAIVGTGTEDYICGAWDFGGRDTAIPFGHLYNGAPYISIPEHSGGRYCVYRWHADNPVTFTTSLKHTIEHGHANDRGDSFYSVCYWYQAEPATGFPALPPVADRVVA